MGKNRRQFTKEFKEEAVRLASAGSRSVREVAESLNVHEGLLAKWVASSKKEGADAFRGQGKRTAVEEENSQLKRRVQNLEMELEFLKKVSRYFAKDPK